MDSLFNTDQSLDSLIKFLETDEDSFLKLVKKKPPSKVGVGLVYETLMIKTLAELSRIAGTATQPSEYPFWIQDLARMMLRSHGQGAGITIKLAYLNEQKVGYIKSDEPEEKLEELKLPSFESYNDEEVAARQKALKAVGIEEIKKAAI